MWPLVTYSNYFDIVSTMTFIDSRSGLISGIFLFKTVILYLFMLYFTWEDQGKKSALFIKKLQVCCMKNKAW